MNVLLGPAWFLLNYISHTISVLLVIQLLILRWGRAWDWHPQGAGGLILAGGFDYLSGGAASLDKFHRIVERSTNNGSSFQVLADFPHGNANGMFEACLVIIDDNTVFLGAGRYGKVVTPMPMSISLDDFHFQALSTMQTRPSSI